MSSSGFCLQPLLPLLYLAIKFCAQQLQNVWKHKAKHLPFSLLLRLTLLCVAKDLLITEEVEQILC